MIIYISNISILDQYPAKWLTWKSPLQFPSRRTELGAIFGIPVVATCQSWHVFGYSGCYRKNLKLRFSAGRVLIKSAILTYVMVAKAQRKAGLGKRLPFGDSYSPTNFFFTGFLPLAPLLRSAYCLALLFFSFPFFYACCMLALMIACSSLSCIDDFILPQDLVFIT